MLSKLLDVYKLWKLHKVLLGRKFTFEAGDLEFTFHPSKICNQEVGVISVYVLQFFSPIWGCFICHSPKPPPFPVGVLPHVWRTIASAHGCSMGTTKQRWPGTVGGDKSIPLQKPCHSHYKSPFTTHKLQQQQPSSPRILVDLWRCPLLIYNSNPRPKQPAWGQVSWSLRSMKRFHVK